MLTIHEHPLYRDTFAAVGKFGDYTIYKSDKVPIEGVALRSKNSIYVNSDVYDALEKSPNFVEYLTAICEHEIKYPEFHADCKRIEKDMEVLGYIKKTLG